MNTYELTVVLSDPATSKDSAGARDKERIVKMVTDFAKKAKGEVNKQESWGAKHMAYMIKKHAIGSYEHFVLTLEAKHQVELEKLLHMDESILRYMFVRV